MRNLLILMLIIVAGISFSCNSKSGGMSTTAKKNLEVNDAITKAYESGDFSKMGDYIAADAVDHGGEMGDVKGLDSIVAQMKRYHDMTPDMKSTMTKSLADDEYVFTWSKTTGTMGGKKMEMSGVDIARFKDGKAVEHWIYMDPKDMMNMMPPPPPPAADSIKGPK
ncbi:MAG: nuclear transport factor 2 family protein [Chitinophagaceae bacterium]